MDQELKILYEIMLQEEVLNVYVDYDEPELGCIEVLIEFRDRYGAKQHWMTTLDPVKS